MSQEELQLRLLQEKHLRNMLNLENQRLLLARENPYKQSPSTIQDQFVPNPKHLPILKSDPVIQKILYYPPSVGESKVADRVLQTIISNWNKECYNIPQNIKDRNMLKYNDRNLFMNQLTSRGRQHIDDMIIYGKKDDYRKAMTIREKYSQQPTHPLFGLNHIKQPALDRQYL